MDKELRIIISGGGTGRPYLPRRVDSQRAAADASRGKDSLCRRRGPHGDAACPGSGIRDQGTSHQGIRPPASAEKHQRGVALAQEPAHGTPHHQGLPPDGGSRRGWLRQRCHALRVRANGHSLPHTGAKLLCGRHQQAAGQPCQEDLRGLRGDGALLPRRPHHHDGKSRKTEHPGGPGAHRRKHDAPSDSTRRRRPC